MCQEKKEEEDLPALRTVLNASTQGLKDNIKKSKERLISTANNSISNMSTNRNTTKEGNRNRKKNNYIDISNEKTSI